MRSPRAALETTHSTIRKCVLEGAFESGNLSEWKRPKAKLLIFVSSTFTDTQVERNYLETALLFELREQARKHGIQVIFVDMRTGIRDENTFDHRTWIECEQGINWCKEESMGCCFISLQGNKYGYTPIPKTLSKTDLDIFLETKEFMEDMLQQIQTWYDLDANAIIPQ